MVSAILQKDFRRLRVIRRSEVEMPNVRQVVRRRHTLRGARRPSPDESKDFNFST